MPLPLSTLLCVIALVALGFHEEAIAFGALGAGLTNELIRAVYSVSQLPGAQQARVQQDSVKLIDLPAKTSYGAET